MSMKNSNDTIGNQSHDLPVCIAVPPALRHHLPQCRVLGIIFVMIYTLAPVAATVLCKKKFCTFCRRVTAVINKPRNEDGFSQQSRLLISVILLIQCVRKFTVHLGYDT
jgi:hypothetical protein